LLINECIKNKIKIFPIPGPSAVTSAMSISGFNDKYLFFGFLPNSEGQIEKELEKLRQFPYTIIFFISPQKINKILKYFKRFFHNRNILIAREMTKIYEEYIRENIETLKLFDNKPKGELTVVVSNIFESKKKLKVLSQPIKKEIINMLKKYSSKDVASFMSRKEDISKKIVYDYCLKQKK
jgi:16S rRNA (cytidine1402-2'-O)-methyltransferase